MTGKNRKQDRIFVEINFVTSYSVFSSFPQLPAKRADPGIFFYPKGKAL